MKTIKLIHKVTTGKVYQILELSFCWIVSIILLAALFETVLAKNFIYQIICAAIVLFWAGRSFIYQAFYEAFKSRRLNISASVFISSQVCFWYSLYIVLQIHFNTHFQFNHYYFLEAVSIITYIKTGDLITDSLQDRIQIKVNHIKSLHIDKGLLITNLKTQAYSKVDIKIIKPGDKLLVKSHAKIPLDGRAYSLSNILVNETIITGESNYVSKENYEKVVGGTLNVGGDFILTVEKDYQTGTVAQIIKRVDEMQTQKPKLQHLSDKILNWFLPIVLFIAAGTFILQYFDGYQFNQILHYLRWTNPNNKGMCIQWALFTTVAVLVVACPCAFGIAIPVAVAIGVAKARTIGATFAHITTFEQIKDIKVLALDKTGTLTEGKMKMQAILGNSQNLPLIYALEMHSSHPIARTFNNYYEQFLHSKFTNKVSLTDVKEVHGIGMQATFNNCRLQLISYELALENNYKLTSDLQVELNRKAIHKQPLTKIALVKDKIVENVFVVGDTVRKNSSALVKWFNKNNVEVVMITGDNRESATYIADQLNITHFHAQAKPYDKQAYIVKLQKKYPGKVAYVGDGFNDLMALKQADMSIAIGEGNQNLSGESDIVLNNSDIATVAKIYKLTRFTRRLIIFNLFWAFSYNLLNIPLAVVGIIPPLFSAILMSLSTVVLVLISIAFLGLKIKIPDS